MSLPYLKYQISGYTTFPVGAGSFLLVTASRAALGPTRPPVQWVPVAHSLGVGLTTRLRLVPRSGMRGAVLPLPQCVFMAWCLVGHRDNFTFTFTFTFITVVVAASYPVGAGDSLPPRQTGSGVHPTFYPRRIGEPSLGTKRPER
jgi:hypothetical protein